jgi:hypothetical protein
MALALSACTVSNPPDDVGIKESPAAVTISGRWEISHATDGNGADYSLQTIYGTGISYGGVLSLNDDGTFSKYIGITNGDSDAYEGSYSVEGDILRLEYRNGTVEEAEYLPESDQIKIEQEDFLSDGMIAEYWERK